MISTTLIFSLLLPLAASRPGGPPSDQSTGNPGKPISPPKTCIITSKSNFAWDVSLQYHTSQTFTTPAHLNNWGVITLNLTNPAVPENSVYCTAGSNRAPDFFSGDQWFSCDVNDTAKAMGLGETRFRYSTNGTLDLNQSWACDG